MRKLASLSMVFVLALAGVALAGDAETVTLEGEMQCATCTLHEEGLADHQDVLVVKKGDKTLNYYLAETASHEKMGSVCMKSMPVSVTGEVEEKDGRMWIAATKIEKIEKEG